tara:strand:- start:1324 stop:2139 length:816 start_codon:yes stop_codon:yes gene_type:complete
MPTPLEILLDPLSLVVLAVYAGLMGWELAFPGRVLPSVQHWRLKGTAFFFAFLLLSTYLPLLWDRYLAAWQLFDLTGLGDVGGAVAGLLIYEAVAYAWHRLMHATPLLWRSFHQMHHSAERLDMAGAFYFSPLDMIGWSFVGSFALVLIVGLTPTAATGIVLATTLLAMFQHANIRTPRWLGYLVQRPESHTLHHGRGRHRDNYADLPVFDMLFGSFHNPKGYELPTGFYPGGSSRVLDMLLARDIGQQRLERDGGRRAPAIVSGTGRASS